MKPNKHLTKRNKTWKTQPPSVKKQLSHRKGPWTQFCSVAFSSYKTHGQSFELIQLPLSSQELLLNTTVDNSLGGFTV